MLVIKIENRMIYKNKNRINKKIKIVCKINLNNKIEKQIN